MQSDYKKHIHCVNDDGTIVYYYTIKPEVLTNGIKTVSQ